MAREALALPKKKQNLFVLCWGVGLPRYPAAVSALLPARRPRFGEGRSLFLFFYSDDHELFSLATRDSWMWPFVARIDPLGRTGLPVQSVKRPPASSTKSAAAA